ncbi:LPD11 domain-containing protein [Bacillus safensis]|uniref:Large polyvalent protein-associated domain-containing protein n=1 Tax=Bacillus safensis TaxID=561879 RepID=A0A1L6ZPE8_BACIA|nr:LPD11 domain-containing protein [Bacillus safensis]APT48378.1 hypothetical protein BSA145_21180 [Bacillus safensis]
MKFDILKADEKFRYQLLSRMKQDCYYYLGNGGRNPENLWASNEEKQLKTMKELWKSFPPTDTPEWLTWEDIVSLESRMIGNSSQQTTLDLNS